MSIFDKFKNLLGLKDTTEKSIETLADKLAQTAEDFLTYDGLHNASIRMHLEAGELACSRAFDRLKADDQNEAEKQARCGLIHLHMATLHLQGKSPARVELNATPDTTEGALNELIQRIAKTKLLVEYGDLMVNAAAQESLLNVINVFNNAIDDLTKQHVYDARRGASAALVALHWTLNLLELSNPGQNLSSLKTTDYPYSRYELRACEFADKITQSRIALSEFATQAEVDTHLSNAEAKFKNCIENIIESNNESVLLECRAGLLDLQLAETASKNCDEKKERRQNQETRQTVSQFKQDVQRVLKLAENLEVDSRSLEQRLHASERFFIDAHKRLETNDLQEAERLGRAAHLDLDFSWQLANAFAKAEYRTDI